MSCQFDSLREHRPSQCPVCNSSGWMTEQQSPERCDRCFNPLDGKAIPTASGRIYHRSCWLLELDEAAERDAAEAQ